MQIALIRESEMRREVQKEKLDWGERERESERDEFRWINR